MQDVLTRLTEWRLAEQRLDTVPVGSPEWERAAEDVDLAHTAYRAELAQATARVHESELTANRDWWAPALGAALRSTNRTSPAD